MTYLASDGARREGSRAASPAGRTLIALGGGLSLLIALLLAFFFVGVQRGDAVPTRNAVLVLGSTVSGGSSSLEAQVARDLGLQVDVVDAAQWAAMTAADFGAYRAVVLGDSGFSSPSAYQPAADNALVWGPQVQGNVVLIGTDPVDHRLSGGEALVRQGIAFAVDDPARTGLYVSLSDAYNGASPGTEVPALAGLSPGEAFRIEGSNCFEQAHIVVEHPVINQLTDADLSNWGCSVHNTFTSYPTGFAVLAIASGLGDFIAPDGSVGTPYILARGAGVTYTFRNYVALGDSVAAGEGIADGFVWNPLAASGDGRWQQGTPTGWDLAYQPEACHQTPDAHPRIVARLLIADLLHLACTGASAAAGVIGSQIIEDGAGGPRVAVEAQLGAPGGASPNARYDQLRPDVVSLSIGANDLPFADIVTKCYTPLRGCQSDAHVQSRLSVQREGLRRILREIKRRGEAAGTVPLVAITEYYDPFPSQHDDSCPDITLPNEGGGSFGARFGRLSSGELSTVRRWLRQLNRGLRAVAAEPEFTSLAVVMPAPRDFALHRWCSDSPWVYGPSIQLYQERSKAPFHPTADGQMAIALDLAALIESKRPLVAGAPRQFSFPSGVRISVGPVTRSGSILVQDESDAGPFPPASTFQKLSGVQITSTAVHPGPITVSLQSAAPASLYHHTAGAWQLVPSTYSNGFVTGQVDSLSPFALGQPVPRVTARAAPLPGPVASPAQVSFNGSSSGTADGGPISSYEWDFDDGETATGPTPSHRFRTAGEYLVRLRVTSAAGGVDETVLTALITNAAPVARISARQVVRVGEAVRFDASGSTDGRGPVSAVWRFGDGSQLVPGTIVEHVFTAAGRYEVALSVTDNEGEEGTASAIVTVQGPAPAAPPAGGPTPPVGGPTPPVGGPTPPVSPATPLPNPPLRSTATTVSAAVPKTVRVGARLLITARIRSGAGVPAGRCVLERRVGRRWSALARAVVSNGRCGLRVRFVTPGASRVRVRFIGRGFADSVTNARSVVARAARVVLRHPAALISGRRATILVQVSPAAGTARQSCVLQRRLERNRWRTVATSRLDRGGTCTLSTRILGSGPVALRVRVPGQTRRFAIQLRTQAAVAR